MSGFLTPSTACVSVERAWYNWIMMVHSRKTNLKAGVVNNVDFAILHLGSRGPTRFGDLKKAFIAWRGYFPAGYLFSREYCYISKSALDVSISLDNPGIAFGTNRTTYWYRVKRGVYALNVNGIERLAKVLRSAQ